MKQIVHIIVTFLCLGIMTAYKEFKKTQAIDLKLTGVKQIEYSPAMAVLAISTIN
jgi:hypothetical protein